MRLIDADPLIEELEKVYESLMSEVKDANEHPERYTSQFIPATAGRIDGIADAEIVIADAPTIEPDGDLISRRDVIELVKKSYYDLSDGEEDMWAMVHDVEQLPSAPDSRQRREWWIREYEYFTCSECGDDYWNGCDCTEEAEERLRNGDYPKFCPNCGAKMRGEEE